MLQRYKLRLGDGTVLLVDHDGLKTWLVDRTAAVQTGRSRKWLPLKEFLAQERAAARRQAQRATPREASPPATPSPAREEPPPREDGLPLVPPPPREDGLPLVPPPPREDGLPLVPPPPPKDARLAVTPPPAPKEEPPVVASPPENESLPLGPPLSEFSESPAGFGAPPENQPIARITVGEPRLVEHEAPGCAAAPVPADAIEPSPIGEPPVQVLADEPAVVGAGGSQWEPIADLPAVPLKPFDEEVPRVSPNPGQDAGPAFLAAPLSVQALADDPVASAAEQAAAPSRPDDELPVIPLKRLDDRGEVPRPASPRFGAGSSPGDVVPAEALWRDGRAASVLRAVGTFGTVLSRCLEPINRLERGLPAFVFEDGRARLSEPSPRQEARPPAHPVRVSPEIRPLAEEPTSAPEEPRLLSMDDSLRIIPFKPTDDDAGAEHAKGARGLFVRATGWVDDLKERVVRLTRRERLRPSITSEEPSAPPVPAPLTTVPARREALQSPPAISELPVLRFAPTVEPAAVESIYEGDENESLVPAAWLWTKRLVGTTALLAVGVFAAANRAAWLPQAAELGERGLIQIDEGVRYAHFAKRQQLAVDEAARDLPHLAPETIRLIMSSSPIRVLDTPDVFEIACEATDRGLPALIARDGEELKTLQRELIDSLQPAERDRVREFDRARARGAAFPFDVRQGLRLYARGARELPSESRERLQVLLGRAIAAGLAHPTELTPTGSADGR